METYKFYDSFSRVQENQKIDNYSDYSDHEEEIDDMKRITQILMNFNQQIENESILLKIINELTNECTHSHEIIFSHPLYSQTHLIDHFISLISTPTIHPDIKLQAIYSISSFIQYFDDNQIASMINLPFMKDVYYLLIYYNGENQNDFESLNVSKILRFLSNLSLATSTARDEIILKFPNILEPFHQEEYSSINSKAIDVFRQIFIIIQKNTNRTRTKYFLNFFKCLCYYPMGKDASDAASTFSTLLLGELGREHYEDLIKINWYICKNNFSEIVSSKYGFFDAINIKSFYEECSIKTLKCTIKVLLSMINCPADLSLCIDFKILGECAEFLEKNRSVIILNFIDSMISYQNITNDDNIYQCSRINDIKMLKDIYLHLFLRNHFLIHLKNIIDSNNGTIEQKISSLRILKTIAFRNRSVLINKIVKKNLVKSILELLSMQDLDIASFVLSIFLAVFNGLNDNGYLASAMTQIEEIGAYDIINDMMNDLNFSSENKESNLFDDVYHMGNEALKLIDSFTEINNSTTCYGNKFFSTDSDDEVDFVRDANDDLQYLREKEIFQQAQANNNNADVDS